MTKNLRGGAQPGAAERGDLSARYGKLSMQHIKQADEGSTSISWRVRSQSLNPDSTEDSDYMSGEKEKKLSLGFVGPPQGRGYARVLPQRQA